LIGLAFVIWNLGFWIGGCASTQQEVIATTTTTGGETTTTAGPSGRIKGEISWGWTGYNTSDRWGTLLVGLWPNESFDWSNKSTYKIYNITTGETSVDYELSPASAANYYMMAVLFAKRIASPFDEPAAGDKIGQYSDGQMPIAGGGSTHADLINYAGAALSGKNFSLNATVVEKTTTTSSSTTTIPIVSEFQDAFGVAVNGNGDVCVTGWIQDSTGNYDIFLTKYDSSESEKWTRQLGTNEHDEGQSVAVDTGGNIYISGGTGGNLDGNTNAGVVGWGSWDIFLTKYDPSGTKQWTRQLGTVEGDWANSLTIDTGNNVCITGYTDGSLEGNANSGGQDVFLVKYNSAGVKQWTRQLGTSNSDAGRGVAVDTSGNIYITGYTNGGLDGNTNIGGEDIFLVKYNSAGTKQWTRQLGTTSSDAANGLALDASGNIYITGSTYGGLDGNTNMGMDDIFLVKYNSAGTKQWTRQLGTSNSDAGRAVAADTGGNIYITGSTAGSLEGNTGTGPVFLIKYNSSGTRQWTRQFGSGSYATANGLATDTSGYIYIAGQQTTEILLVKYNSAGVKQ